MKPCTTRVWFCVSIVGTQSHLAEKSKSTKKSVFSFTARCRLRSSMSMDDISYSDGLVLMRKSLKAKHLL